MEGLEILPRRLRTAENGILNCPDALDEVVDALEALVTVAVEKFVRLFRVMQVRVVFPLDVKALHVCHKVDQQTMSIDRKD